MFQSQYIILLLLCIIIILIYALNKCTEPYRGILPNFLFLPRIHDLLFQKPQNSMPPVISRFLSKYGNYQVVRLELCRKPVQNINKEVLNTVTLGNLKRELQKKGVDALLHLWCNVTLSNGKTFSIEKTDTVQIREMMTGTDCFTIPSVELWQVTLNDLIKNAERVHPGEFWTYNPATNNCQHFVLSLLNGSGYLTPDSLDFLNQRADEILEESGFTVSVITKLINLASNIRRALTF